MSQPNAVDRSPLATDNPRHAVWIEDEQGLRRVTALEPGADSILVGGRAYQHTREIGSGQWVYTLTEVA